MYTENGLHLQAVCSLFLLNLCLGLIPSLEYDDDFGLADDLDTFNQLSDQHIVKSFQLKSAVFDLCKCAVDLVLCIIDTLHCAFSDRSFPLSCFSSS